MGWFKKKTYHGPMGSLVLDMSEPGFAPYLALDGVSALDEIAKCDYVTLRVVRTKTDSQK